MTLKKKSETATRITFEIVDVPAGVEAFAFYADGRRVSKTCKSGQREVTFSKGAAAYTVTAVAFAPITSASYPSTPPPPPPTYKKVAPRVAYKTDRADARYCLFESDGRLRPGVTRRPDGKYTDESGAVYTDGDGLDESGVRSPAPAVTSASNIDGRPYCSLPLEGDPTKNTGSWTI